MISLIVPVFNNINSIYLVFESIVHNLTKNDELIIIDDSSSDGTWEALILLKKQNYNFNFILQRNKTNLGISSSLNRGIKYATKPYIARHDGDDIIINGRFKYQLEILLANPKIDLLSSSKIQIQDYKNKININSVYNLVKGIPQELNRKTLAIGNVITHPGVICKTNILKENLYDKSFNAQGEDYHLWLRLMNKNYNLYIDKTPVIIYFEYTYPRKIKKQLLGSIKVRLLSLNFKYPIFCFYLFIGIFLDFIRLLNRFRIYA